VFYYFHCYFFFFYYYYILSHPTDNMNPSDLVY
jgi:hypothetical protein